MADNIIELTNAHRGYHVVYRMNEVNHCPGCGRSHWLLGRTMAECAFCTTALPYEDTPDRGPVTVITRQNRHIAPAQRGRFVINGQAA